MGRLLAGRFLLGKVLALICATLTTIISLHNCPTSTPLFQCFSHTHTLTLVKLALLSSVCMGLNFELTSESILVDNNVGGWGGGVGIWLEMGVKMGSNFFKGWEGKLAW